LSVACSVLAASQTSSFCLAALPQICPPLGFSRQLSPSSSHRTRCGAFSSCPVLQKSLFVDLAPLFATIPHFPAPNPGHSEPLPFFLIHPCERDHNSIFCCRIDDLAFFPQRFFLRPLFHNLVCRLSWFNGLRARHCLVFKTSAPLITCSRAKTFGRKLSGFLSPGSHTIFRRQHSPLPSTPNPSRKPTRPSGVHTAPLIDVPHG